MYHISKLWYKIGPYFLFSRYWQIFRIFVETIFQSFYKAVEKEESLTLLHSAIFTRKPHTNVLEIL